MSALEQLKAIIERAEDDEVTLGSLEISHEFASSLAYDFVTYLSFDNGKGEEVSPSQEDLLEGLLNGPNLFSGIELIVVEGQEAAIIARKKVIH